MRMKNPPYYRHFELLMLPIGMYLLWLLSIQPLWKSLFFSVLLTISFYGWYTWVQEKLRFPAGLAAMSIAVIAFAVPVVPGYFAVSYTAATVSDTIQALGDIQSQEYQLVQTMQQKVGALFPALSEYTSEPGDLLRVTGLLGNNLETVAQFSQTILGSLYSSLVSLGVGVSVVLFALFYLLRYGKSGLEYMEKVLPLRDEYIERAFAEFTRMTRALVKMTFIVGFIQGGIGGLVLFMLGTPSALMWTIAMMILSMMPVLGAGAILVPTAVVYFTLGDVFSGVVVLATFAGVSVLDNILKPWIIGKDIPLNEGAIMLSVIGGLIVFGPIGVFVGPIMFNMIISMFDTHIKVYDAAFREPAVPVVFTRSRDNGESK